MEDSLGTSSGEGGLTVEGWWAASYLVLWLLVVVLGIVVVALARQIGTLHLRLGPRGALEIDGEGPPLGEPAPLVEASTLDGRSVSIGGPAAPRLLTFVSPGCHVCAQVLPAVPVISRSNNLEGFVITDVDAHETVSAFGSKDMGVPVLPAPAVLQAYDVPGTPYVVVLDEAGFVRAKGTVNNLEQMEGLVDTGVRRTREAQLERQAS